MKWKNYSRDENTPEKLSYVVSLQEPYKYLTEVNKNHREFVGPMISMTI